MTPDAAAWDARYLAEGYPAGTEPASILQQLLPLLPHGRALELATGAGRNAVFLAANGWRVVAVDSSRTGLDRAEALARERGIEVQRAADPAFPSAPKHSGLVLYEVDLERAALPTDQFELVLCIKYLQRSLFPAIVRTLRRGGLLLYETYTVEQLAFSHGPRNLGYLLRHGELREAFPGLQALFYRELRAGKGIATLLARKP